MRIWSERRSKHIIRCHESCLKNHRGMDGLHTAQILDIRCTLIQPWKQRPGHRRYIAFDYVSMKAADLSGPVGTSSFSLITITNHQQCNYQGLGIASRNLNNGSGTLRALFNSKIKLEICYSLKCNKKPCPFTSMELLGPLGGFFFTGHQSNIHAIE